MNAKKITFAALSIITILAAFLRFWQLGINPPSLTWDEVAWGYNAYSLGVDGRDEFGRFLPLDYIESFGDFKPVVYAYLDVIPVKLFGLNEFAVRFPSAFFGTLTVLLTYFLTKRIFSSREKSSLHNIHIALLASFFLAISPWHINLSRAAFEANVATFFLVAGVWAFLKALQENKWYLVASSVFFALSLYTFNTSRIVAPLLACSLVIGFWKQLILKKKEVLIACIVGILFLLPSYKFLLSPQASLRFKEVNIFTDIDVIKRANQQIQNDDNAWWSKIIHNRRLVYGVEYLRHYFDNLNPSFLFIKGDGNPKFSTQDVGQMYLWDSAFFIIGILVLFRLRQGNWWVIPIWIVVGIIPAATARETPHGLRIETIIPTFQILTAYGFLYVINKLSTINYKLLIIPIRSFIFPLFFFFLIFNSLYYLHGYYAHYPYEYSGEWQYGYKESIHHVRSNEKEYKNIYITTALGRPYIYYLFYTNTPPAVFREKAIVTRDVFGFVSVDSFGKYNFSKDIKKTSNSQEALFIDTPSNIPSNATILKEFKLLNGQIVLVAYKY